VGGAIGISPPLVVDEHDLREIADGMLAGLDAVR
jgi:hypothetical protein